MAMFERTRRSGRFACLATLFFIAVAFVPGAQRVAFGENVSAVRGQEWAVDPTVPGENIPGEGRSLFDFLVARSRDGKIELAVPFPLEALVARIESELQPPLPGVPAMKAVLIPRGRSLQRSAGEPRPYVYPRVVMAVDTESRLSARDAGKLLKDRVYLGYHEKAEILEVISYNEAAGRFEFQVVKDYRAGGIPRVFYANRAVCTACHQNAAPIFARQLWDETNANVVVAARLARERQRFYGISPNRGVDVPYAVDNATDRANLQSAYQLLWRDGCQAARDSASAIRCRAALFTAALQYRMTDRQQYQ
ncbi:MAG TPA: hypothetical protein VNT02_00320, partial [Burkholderiales bacterium]|nr:hypothetical protein [Burkholderiales bacterium]